MLFLSIYLSRIKWLISLSSYVSVLVSPDLAMNLPFNTLFYYSITSIFRFLWLLISFRFFLSIIIILSATLFAWSGRNFEYLSTVLSILCFVVCGGISSSGFSTIGFLLAFAFLVILRFIYSVLAKAVVVQLVISINLLKLRTQALLWLGSGK